MFVNLWSEPLGHSWAYPAVYDLVLRLRERTGIDVEPHAHQDQVQEQALTHLTWRCSASVRACSWMRRWMKITK